jgi:hypothetical protein
MRLYGIVTTVETGDSGMRVVWETLGELLVDVQDGKQQRSTIEGTSRTTPQTAGKLAKGSRINVLVRVASDRGRLIPGPLAD